MTGRPSVGFTQWLVIRKQLPKTRWLLATILGSLVGLGMTVIAYVFALQFTWDNYELTLFFTFVGALFGGSNRTSSVVGAQAKTPWYWLVDTSNHLGYGFKLSCWLGSVFWGRFL